MDIMTYRLLQYNASGGCHRNQQFAVFTLSNVTPMWIDFEFISVTGLI